MVAASFKLSRLPLAFSTSNFRHKLAFGLIAIGVIGIFLAELTLGVVAIPLSEIVSVLIGQDASRATWTRIVIDLRLPRALTALFAGSALGASGLLMQTLFRNPLASPWTLGMAAGSSLGVALLVVLAGATSATAFLRFGAFANISLAAAAAIGCTLTLLFILAISRRVSTVTLLIVGLMTHYFIEGLVSLLLHLTDETQVRVFNGWNDGSYANVSWPQLKVLAPVVIIGVTVSTLLIKPLNALLLGENYARTLGLTVRTARLWAFATTTALAGVVTAYCGPVVFLGIAVPHLCRGMFKTADHRTLMPASILVGALLGLIGDLVMHLDWGVHVFHLNTVNALIGAPIVLWAILRRKSNPSLEA
jgi:iron complex transport system permease protein